jgi:hypothetical protein
MAALFTTTEVFRQVLIELARRPEYVEPLREEISGAMVDGKITGASLVNMQLLDSFMKESRRQIPQLGNFSSNCQCANSNSISVIMERLVTRDTRLPNGAVYLEELTLGLTVERTGTLTTLKTPTTSMEGDF